MINSILIENFQSHEKTKLELDPGVNSIIGSSDRGKTVILRAIRKVAQNKPGGTAFRSNWGGDTFIKIETDDEAAVSRLITNKDNLYILDTPNEEQKFKAFGQGVPEEILSALNMDEENIQSQMDSPFLFSASDGEVGKRLNEAANLEKIDHSQTYINTKIRSHTADLKQSKASIKTLNEDLKKTDFIEEAENKLQVIESQEKEYKVKEQEAGDLSYLLTQIEEAEEKLKEFDFLETCSKDYEKLVTLQKEHSTKEENISDLDNLIEELEEIEKSILQHPDTSKAAKELKALTELFEEYNKKEEEVEELADLLDDIETVNEDIEELDKNLVKWKKEFKKLMPDDCPLCGGLE